MISVGGADKSNATFTKTDLARVERELLSQCERTKRGDEVNAIRAFVAGGEREAIGRLFSSTTTTSQKREEEEMKEEEEKLAREGRVVLKMARQKEKMDEFTYAREEGGEEVEKLTEMNTESAKRTFEIESRGWDTEKTVGDDEKEEEKEGEKEEVVVEEEEEEDRTQRYGGTPTQTQANTYQHNNSVGQSRNDLFRASGVAGGETDDPQGTQRVEPSFAEEEEDVRDERATEPPPPLVTTIAATQDDVEEEEEESEDDEDIEIVGTQVIASEDEQQQQQQQQEKGKGEDAQQRAHDTMQDVAEDTAAQADLDLGLEGDEEGPVPILATPLDAPPAKNEQPPRLPPRRGNAGGSVIPATELSMGTQNVSATAPLSNAHVATVKVVASAAENALRKQMEARKKQAFGIESVAPQSLNPNSSDVEMQTERSKEDREQEQGDGDDNYDDDNNKNDDDDDDDLQHQHNQSPDLAEYYSQRVNETDDEDEIEDDEEEEDEVVYRSQLTQQDDEGGVLHRPRNVKFSMPVILGDGEISSSDEEEEEDDCENMREEKEEEEEEEDMHELEDDDDEEYRCEDEDEELRGTKRKIEIPSHAMRASKRKRKPKKFFDDTQREEEDVDIEEKEEEQEQEEEEEEAPRPQPSVPQGTTRRRSSRAATTTITTQKTSPPTSTTLTKNKKAAPTPASKTPASTATFSSASKGQTWSNYLPGCPKCRYSSCNACRPMHIQAINGDEKAQQRVIKWNERREEKVASASRSLGQKAKAPGVRMRRTSSVHAAARTINMSLTPQKQTSTATKSRKSATDKRRKSTQSVQQSRRRNSVEDSAEKRKSITGGGGGGRNTTALFSGLSFMITSMPSSRVMNEMRASITENGGRLLDSIPKFNSSKRVPARKQVVILPTMKNNIEKRKETAKCLYARAIGARLRSVRWVRESLEKNRIMENDGQNATQPTKLNFQGTSFLLLGNTFFQDEFSNLMLHAGANAVMTCGKMTKKALNQALRRAHEEQNEIHAVVIQSSEKLSREIKSALSESRKIVVRHDWLTESLQRGEILEFLDYEVHL